MAKKSTHRDSQIEDNQIEDATTNAADRLAALAAPLAQSLDRSSAAWLKSLVALEEEAIRIATNRLERDSEAVRQCQECKSVGDRFAVQQKWLVDMGQDYIQDGLRFSKVMQDIFADSFAELTEAATTAARRGGHEAQSAASAAAGE